MARREAKHLKALYFDLRVKDLKEHFSETNPNGAYGEDTGLSFETGFFP